MAAKEEAPLQETSTARRSRAASPGAAKKKDEPKDDSTSTSASSSKLVETGQARWGIAKLCLGARLTVQANRIILGPMMPFITSELGFSKEEQGHIMSAFASGYALTQIPGGNAADRIGSKKPLILALFAVSVGSLLTPFAADFGGKQGLWWVYFIMGLLEGPSYPSIGSMLGKWFPTSEKSTANSRTGTGGSVGGLLAIGIGPMLAERIGWRPTFMIVGAASIAFSCVWTLKSADKPVTCAWVSESELKFLREQGVKGAMPETAGDSGSKKFPWLLFRYPEVLAVCYAHAVFNFGRYFLYAWIPTFYVELGMNATKAGVCMTCLQIADALIEFTTGPVADRMIKSKTFTVVQTRKLLSCAGFLGFGTTMLVCCFVRDVVGITVLLAFGKACASMHTAGFKTNYLDLTARDTGTLVGVGNTLATVASMLAPLLAGYILEHYSWNQMFQLVFAVNLSGCLLFGTLASSTSIDEVEVAKKVD